MNAKQRLQWTVPIDLDRQAAFWTQKRETLMYGVLGAIKPGRVEDSK